MSLTKYASFEVSEILDVKGAQARQTGMSLSKIADYNDYRTSDGYLYVRIRAISSRVNKNHDGWPSVELAGSKDLFERHHSAGGFTVEASDGNSEYGFSTFVGKPIFVDHHNSNPKKARGVIVDSKLRVLDHKVAGKDDPYWGGHDVDAEHMPPTEVELLLEVDAKSFPRLAKAIVSGDLDGFSMGCFVAGTPITLDDGTQKVIEDIEVGDQVLTHTGEIEKVTTTMTRHYKGDVYHIGTYGQAKTLTMTDEHPVWVSRPGQSKREWVEAKDLEVGDYVLTPYHRPHTIAVDRGNHAWARLIGFYLAEGNLGYDKQRYPDKRPVFVEWNFHVDEVDYINSVKRDLATCGYQACGPYVKNNCATVRCNSPELAASFLATAGQHSWAKKLAPAVLGWSQVDQRELLQSYFAGDGHMRPHTVGKVEVGTASKDLAHQIFTLSTRVGYRTTPPVKQHSPSAAKKRPKYSMYVDTRGNEPAGNWKGFLNEEGLWRQITKIDSEHFEGPVYNFDVQGPDSYVAADIAVHNCDVDKSVCSHCKHEASNPDEYCSHILMKGAHHDFKTADGKRVSKKSYENCYGIKFFEISAVFDPADETALAREVRSSVQHEADVVPGPPPGVPGSLPDPVRPHNLDGEQYALWLQEHHGIDPETALDLANRKMQQQHGQPSAHGEGDVYTPQMKDYALTDTNGMPGTGGLQGFPPPVRPQPEGVDNAFFDAGQEALDEQWPRRPVQNDPRWSKAAATHTAENPLPQSFETRAPDEVDTLREEHTCPICGSDMDAETCDVCGFVEPPKEFDNPDLNKAEDIREQMKQNDEQQAEQPAAPGGPAGPSGGPNPGSPLGTAPGNPGGATKASPTASVTNDMRWTPKVHPKTAARINVNERPVTTSNRPISDEPKNETVVSDQTRPVTAAMQTAQRLMAIAQRSGGSMSTRTADGPTPPGASPDKRVDVEGVGGVDQASNTDASKADAQVDPTGRGGTGVEGVEPDSTTSLPTADRDGDDSGFNKDKNLGDGSGKTKTYEDSDGTERAYTDPVTRDAFPRTEDGVKSHRQAYEDGTLEQQDQQGNKPVAQGGKAVQGVKPIAEEFGKRVNVLEHTTSPANNSGETKTWSGTDGNGVTKQQEPVTREPTQFGGVKANFVRAIRLAETEAELGLLEGSKWDRVAELDEMNPVEVQAQLETLARVKTAGLAKLAMTRQSGVRSLPRAFGKQTAAPNGFERIAHDVAPEPVPVSDADLDSALFTR